MKRRIRPKKYFRNTSDHTKLKRRWKSWLPQLENDLQDLMSKKEIFWELQDIANENPEVLKPYAFFDWMCRNYMISISIGIRKFIDQDSRSRSLWVMLYQILEHPGIVNLSQRQVRSDLRLMEDKNKRIRRLVNKRIAHFNSPGAIRMLPTFNEVDESLKIIDELFCKYNSLLTGETPNSVCSTPQYDWMDVLRKSWIIAGSKFHKN